MNVEPIRMNPRTGSRMGFPFHDREHERVSTRGEIIKREERQQNQDIAQISPQKIVLVLWSTVWLANTALSLAGSVHRRELLNVFETTSCGLLISLGLSFATQSLIERNARVAWPVMSMLVLLAGSSLWAIDAILQAQTIGPNVFYWPTLKNLMVFRFNLVYYNLLFALQTAALALLTSNRLIRTRERQLAEARLSAQQARLAALRFQLNPHFLFNTLNAISTLVAESGASDAEEMISRLADFLRLTLITDPEEFITLEMEMEMVQAYLDIEFVRFADRLTIRYGCPAELRDVLVPSMVLQPLVENAIKYAVAPAKEMVTLMIEATATANELVIVVEDQIQSEHSLVQPPGTGLGLKNVAGRLEALYGNQASMHAAGREKGFLVVLRMPLKRTPVSNGMN